MGGEEGGLCRSGRVLRLIVRGRPPDEQFPVGGWVGARSGIPLASSGGPATGWKLVRIRGKVDRSTAVVC